jgi:hypothetical protein
MELIATVLGMLLAFILGAYIRQPFERKPRSEPEIKPQADLEEIKLTDEERKLQERRQEQLLKAWNYTGKPVDEGGDD